MDVVLFSLTTGLKDSKSDHKSISSDFFLLSPAGVLLVGNVANSSTQIELAGVNVCNFVLLCSSLKSVEDFVLLSDTVNEVNPSNNC